MLEADGKHPTDNADYLNALLLYATLVGAPPQTLQWAVSEWAHAHLRDAFNEAVGHATRHQNGLRDGGALHHDEL